MDRREKTRIERDVLGELEVPEKAYWGINTQRAIENFKISGRPLPRAFIVALARVKKACLLANAELGLIDEPVTKPLLSALDEILVEGKHLDQFPVDTYQTGSGTQANMNMNEVLANRAAEILGQPMGRKHPVHPNDHVNKGQSSNDVIPAAMHVATVGALQQDLFPAIDALLSSLDTVIARFDGVVKVGRTHLQDAVPIPLSMEFSVYKTQVMASKARVERCADELLALPLGGTATGTGIGTHASFPELACKHLSALVDGATFVPATVLAEGIASHGTLAVTSSMLRGLALAMMKMANDVRWMGSGPRAGLGELSLPANEPGSSIMPGKVNPTQCEALIQVCLQVIGHDATIGAAEAHGSTLDLNTCKPLIISNLLDSISLLSNATTSFRVNCLDGLTANIASIQEDLDRILMVVTNLSPVIGYDEASRIAKIAFERGLTIKEAIKEEGIEVDGDLAALLDPRKMIGPDK